MSYRNRLRKTKKRDRPEEFDLNRTNYTSGRKLQKLTKMADKEHAGGNSNMNAFEFIDLADSIMRRDQASINLSNSNAASINDGQEPIAPDVRGLVQDEALSVQRSLEDKIKSMVHKEMTDVRHTMELLARTVKDLSDMVRSQPAVSGNISTSAPNPTNIQTQLNRDSQGRARVVTFPLNGRPEPPGVQGFQINYPPMNSRSEQTPRATSEPLRIRVDKLGLIFDGDSRRLRVDDFIYRLEHMQAQYNIPWEEIIRDFHLIVSGPAYEWFWLFKKTSYGMSWDSLKHALLAQYQTSRSNFEWLSDLVERKQMLNESIDSYFLEMCKLRSRLLQPLPEFDMIKILKRNIKESIGKIVYPMSVSSVEQLRIECNEAERHFPRRDHKSMQVPARPQRHVSEIVEESYENPLEEIRHMGENIDVIRYQQPKSPPTCWNCQEIGHVFMECPAEVRNLFCYRCGKPDTVVPKCPNCKQGNPKVGVERSGDSRLAYNPATQRN